MSAQQPVNPKASCQYNTRYPIYNLFHGVNPLPFIQHRGYVFILSVLLVNCDSGWQLNETIGQCELCPRGFYRDKAQTFYCQMCPRHLITHGKGATLESDCRQGTLGVHDISFATCQSFPSKFNCERYLVCTEM